MAGGWQPGKISRQNTRTAAADGLVARRSRALQRSELFRLVADGAFEPFACFGRKTAGRGFVQLVGMLMRGPAQEADLFAVAAAPLAEQKVETQSEATRQRQATNEDVG